MDEIRDLVRDNPEASAMFALRELHYGRLEWLAEHIRACDFRISPVVARKILALIDRSDPNCFFELKAVRRSDLPPRAEDPQLRDIRDFDMALEVARRGGLQHGHSRRVCHEVGKEFGLTGGSGEYVARRVRPFRERALETIREEEMQAAYERGEIDILGQPISP